MYISGKDVKQFMNLHSTMVLFKFEEGKPFEFTLEFTFHYGPIQITSARIFANMINEFTFHYGPIQMILLFLNTIR